MTNADKIRGMTDEELSKYLSEIRDCATCMLVQPRNCATEETCYKSFLEWLRQPVED